MPRIDEGPDPLTTDIVELLLYHAQNFEMVDMGYTRAGAIMLRAAAEIEALRGGTRVGLSLVTARAAIAKARGE